jgi:hypothetical protein
VRFLLAEIDALEPMKMASNFSPASVTKSEVGVRKIALILAEDQAVAGGDDDDCSRNGHGAGHRRLCFHRLRDLVGFQNRLACPSNLPRVRKLSEWKVPR